MEKINQEKATTQNTIQDVSDQVNSFLQEIQHTHQELLNKSYNERVSRYVTGLNQWKEFQTNFDVDK